MKLSREPQSFSFKAYVSKVDGIGEENSGTSVVKYSPTEWRDEISDENVLYNCISFVKEYADKSLEELRLEDYQAGRVSKELPLGNFIYRFNTAPASNSKSPVKKTGAVKAYEVIAKRFETKFFLPSKRRHGVGEQNTGSTLVKYEPKMDVELFGKTENSKYRRVTYICISIMKEYENKSLEELRLEDYRAGRNVLAKYAQDHNYNPNFFVFGFYENYAFSFRDKDALRFHMVQGGNVRISKDGRSAELTGPTTHGVDLDDTVAFSCRPIRLDEVVHLHLDDIRTNCDDIVFGFTTDNPSDIFPYLPKYTATKEKTLKMNFRNMYSEKNIIHYSVDPTGVLRSGINGQIHYILSGIDISRPLWAVIDLRTCKKVRFVGPEALNAVRLDQPVERAGRSNQSQVEDGTRRPEQVIERAGRSNQNQVEDGARRPEQVIEGAGSSNQSQVEDGARRPEQVIKGAGSSNQSQVESVARRPEQVIEGAGSSNQSQVESVARRPEQVIEEARSSNQSQVEDGTRRPEQVIEGAGSSNQSQVESVARRPEQVIEEAGSSNQSQVESVARGPEQIIEVAGSSNQSQVESVARRPEQVIEEAESSNQSQVESVARRPEQVMEGAGSSNQSRVEVRARRPKQVIEVAGSSNQSQVEVGARCPKHVIEVAGNSNQSQVESVARRSEQDRGAGSSNQSQAESVARRPDKVIEGAGSSNQSRIEVGARRPEQVSYRSLFDDDPLSDQLSSLSVIERSPVPKHLNPVPLSIHRTKGKNIIFTGTGIAARFEGEYCQGYVFSARPMLPGKTITAQILKTDNSLRRSLIIGLTSCDPSTIDPDELPDEAKFLQDRPEYWVIYPDAANGFDIGDELNLTLTLDGKLDVCKNGSDNVAVLHVDHTLKLWAFFDINGATEEVRLFVSELVKQPGDGAVRPEQVEDRIRRPDRLVNGARRSDQVVNAARRSGQVVHEARYYDYWEHEARRPDQVVNRARRSNQMDYEAWYYNNGAYEARRLAQVVNGSRRFNQGVHGARRPDQMVDRARRFEQIELRARRSDQMAGGAKRSDQMVDGASRSDQAVNKVNAPSTVDSMPSTSKGNEQPTNECRICFDNRINCAIYKCGHMCMCYDCAVQQWKNDGRSYGKCPICRAKIQDVIRIYNS